MGGGELGWHMARALHITGPSTLAYLLRPVWRNKAQQQQNERAHRRSKRDSFMLARVQGLQVSVFGTRLRKSKPPRVLFEHIAVASRTHTA